MFKKKILIFVFLLLLILPACWSLFQAGFFPSHDGEWMVIRLSDFHRSLVSGQIPVRWADRLNFGYGYPVFNFLYPLSLYLGEAFHLIGFNFVDAIKLVFLFSFLFSGVGMFCWVADKWGRWAGLAAAALYVYTPYRFLDVYVRGSVGEALVFVFPPLIFWSADRLAKGKSKVFLILGGLSFAGLITSHNTAAMLFTLVFLGYLIFRGLIFRSKKIFLRQLAILFLGLILSCFFWLPALHDKQFVVFDKVVVADFLAHFPTLRQLLVPSWGYGPSLSFSGKDTLSFQAGVTNLLVFLLVFFRLKFANWQKNWAAIYFILAFLVSFLLMLEFSAGLWKSLAIGNLIQFPWRLLMLTTFSGAVLAGWLVYSIKAPQKIFLAGGLIFSAILLNYSYARPEYFTNRPESFYATNEGTTTVANEYLPIWVKSAPTGRAAQLVEIIAGQGEINQLTTNSRRVNFVINSETESVVQINKIYFPGWQVKRDGEKLAFNYDNPGGVIRFPVSAGKHAIVAEFGETPVRLTADIISLLGLGIIIVLVLKRK